MSAKVLITGMSNTGKTSLLKTLRNAFVVSRDGKPFPFEIPHFNVPEFGSVQELIGMVGDKLTVYMKRFKRNPETLVFDSVSRIFTDIEDNCSRSYKGFDVWSNVSKEVNYFVQQTNYMLQEDFNVVLIAHTTWDEKAGRFVETCKGSFAKTGGFLSTVDYAVNVDIENRNYVVQHRGNSLSRSLLSDIPDKQLAKDFNLQEYLDRINEKNRNIKTEWSL